MTKRTSVSRKKRRDNPLVPISAERVDAGIKTSGYSVREAARRIKTSQQTLDSIVHGHTRRCRSSTRRKLSRLLRISEDWLGGADVQPLAGLPPWEPSAVNTGPDFLPRADENLTIYRDGEPLRDMMEWAGQVVDEGKRGIEPKAPLSRDMLEWMEKAVEAWRRDIELAAHRPRYLLHWGYLAERIVGAWRRDIEAGSKEADSALRSFRPGEPGEMHWIWIIQCVERALSLTQWRAAALEPIPIPEVPPGLDHDQRWELAQRNDKASQSARISQKAMESFARNAATAVEEVLSPWLDGKRCVNYSALVRSLWWIMAGIVRPPWERVPGL